MRLFSLPFLLLLAAVLSPALAGVDMVMETTDAAGAVVYRTNFISQGHKVRMDNVVEGNDPDVSTIFLGDRFVVLEHVDRRYAVVDQAMLDQLAAQLDAAVAKMEEDIAELPPEQREMARKELQRGMAQAIGTPTGGKRRVEENGTGDWNGAPCRRYSVYDGPNKSQEICAADLDHIDGAEKALDAFGSMSDYLRKMTASLPAAAAGPNPGELLDRIEGFPVITRDFKMGRIVQTTTLISAGEFEVDDSVFEVPEGYEPIYLIEESPYGTGERPR